MIKKFTMLIIMLFITTAPFYELVLYNSAVTGKGADRILWIFVNGMTLILPMLTSLVIKKEKQMVYYILISYTILAMGEYTYEMSYAAFYRPEFGVKGYLIIRIAVVAMKAFLVIFSFLICEYIYEENGIAETLIIKRKLRKIKKKMLKG